MKKYLTPLGIVNFLFFQWFFIRLCFQYDEEDGNYKDWGFLGGVLPLTGWGTKYKFVLGGPRYLFLDIGKDT